MPAMFASTVRRTDRVGGSSDIFVESAQWQPIRKILRRISHAIMAQKFRSDVAALRAKATHLRQHAGLVGDEETAGKLRGMADDMESWASRIEWAGRRR